LPAWRAKLPQDVKHGWRDFGCGRVLVIKHPRSYSTYFVDGRSWWVTFPIGPAAVMLAALPMLAWIRHRRRRRAQLSGRCLACGYDLRATPERCPECGTISKIDFCRG
jgi:hypothetical protein